MKLLRSEKIDSARIKFCSGPGETSCLIPKEMAWLEKYYFAKYPKYNEIITECEIDKTRSKFKGLKAFPSKANWKPPMRTLLQSEKTTSWSNRSRHIVKKDSSVKSIKWSYGNILQHVT